MRFISILRTATFSQQIGIEFYKNIHSTADTQSLTMLPYKRLSLWRSTFSYFWHFIKWL